MTGRERVQARIQGRPVDSLPLMPITMMFAADTIGVPYLEYVTDHRVLAEAQLETAAKFDFDYVSVISDPAREASDLGAKIQWFDNQPPAVVETEALLSDKASLAGLRLPEIAGGRRMLDRVEGVRLLAKQAGVNKTVEGWVEGPCAMAADLRGLNTLMLDLYDDEGFVIDLFEFVVAMETEFARAQVRAGATLIGIGDAAASLIGPKFYQRFVQPYEQKLIRSIRGIGVPVRLHICGNTRKILSGMGETGADIIDLDFLSPLAEGRAAMGGSQVLLGNMDPVRALRDGSPDSVFQRLEECYAAAGPRYIVGAGCEIARGTPRENVLAMTRFARGRN
ncbi:MAG: uroporphyrinogen decarboxylase family protein [Bryobacterales bacterium]|nr:uroporphyrinogen decarboxylase family protein [Bryobacterales bacterium]